MLLAIQPQLFSNENIIKKVVSKLNMLKVGKEINALPFSCRRNQQLSGEITFLLICLPMFNQTQEQNIH